MRIVALSDTHRLEHKVPIPDGDILIHAGDMTGRGNWEEFITVGRWFKELKSRFTHRIMIAGNHDFGFMFNAKSILKDHFDDDERIPTCVTVRRYASLDCPATSGARCSRA